jgi:hypothetical protein
MTSKLYIIFFVKKKVPIQLYKVYWNKCSVARLRVLHFAIKRRRDNVKKKIENVNKDTIGNEIVTSDQSVNAMQDTFL